MVADRNIGDALADRLDDTAALVSSDDRERALLSCSSVSCHAFFCRIIARPRVRGVSHMAKVEASSLTGSCPLSR